MVISHQLEPNSPVGQASAFHAGFLSVSTQVFKKNTCEPKKRNQSYVNRYISYYTNSY